LPDAPEPLLLERRIETGDDAYVDRITADGARWTWSSVDAGFRDGTWTFGAREPEWEPRGTLSPGELAELRAAIGASGFFETPAEHRAELRGSTEVWTAELDGRRHTATLHGRGTAHVPALATLAAALDAATRQA
jgi:hypothetical protein